MELSARKTISRNILTVRQTLGLSQIKFALLCGISRASLINIESTNTGYNLNLLDRILGFCNLSMEKLSMQEFTLPDNFREKLIELYKNNSAVYVILNSKPPITYAVKEKLLKGNFLNTPKEINQIKTFFEGLGWSFNGPSIQNTLKRMPQFISIEQHKTKKNTNLYSKKLIA